MISEEVRIKKLCVNASRAILEDTVRFPPFLPSPSSGAAAILSVCLLSSPAGFTPSRLLLLHPLLSPRNVHLSLCSPSLSPLPTSRPLSPGVLQVKLEDIISHQSAESAAPLPSPTPFSCLPLPPTKPRRFPPMAPGVMWGVKGGAEVGDGALGEKSPSSVSGSCMGRAVGHFHLQITITVENEGKRGGG